MYINPFVAGIVATVFVLENAILVFAIWNGSRKK